jgi:pyroglutamyl-peptidase
MLGVILLTGFEPFDGDTHNPSSSIARALDGKVHAGLRVTAATLPVDGSSVPHILQSLVTPEVRAVVMLGLARGRQQIALERVAVNWADYRMPDNTGRVRRAERLFEGAPDAHLSSLPLEVMLEAWRAAGVPGYVSNSAGLYLCNQVFFSVRQRHPHLPAGFVHLPSDETLALGKLESFVPLAFQQRTIAVMLAALARWLETRDSHAALSVR